MLKQFKELERTTIKKILTSTYLVLISLIILFVILNKEFLTYTNLNNLLEKYFYLKDHIEQKKLFFSLIYFFVSILWICLLGIVTPMLILSTLMFGYFGSVLSILSFTIGSTMSFLFAKHFKKSFEKSFDKLNVKNNSFFLFIIFRFIPGIPFMIKNFAGIFFNLSNKKFLTATLIAETPQVIVFTFIFKQLIESSEMLITGSDLSVLQQKLFAPVFIMFAFVILLFFLKIKFQKYFKK